jgi:hypothetical protein
MNGTKMKTSEIIDEISNLVSSWAYFARNAGVSGTRRGAIEKTLLKW